VQVATRAIVDQYAYVDVFMLEVHVPLRGVQTNANFRVLVAESGQAGYQPANREGRIRLHRHDAGNIRLENPVRAFCNPVEGAPEHRVVSAPQPGEFNGAGLAHK
jgi:hypothetical protein